MKRTLPASLFTLFSILSAVVSAQNFNPTTGALGFNVFTRNNYTVTGGSIEGAVAIGGDLNLNGSAVFATNNSGSYPTGVANHSTNYGLVIGGKVIFTSGNNTQVNQGFLRIGNTTGARLFYTDCNGAGTNLKITPYQANCNTAFNSNPNISLQRQQANGTATQAHGIDFTTAFSQLTQYSNTINSYQTNNSVASQLNKITIPATSNPHIVLQNNKVNYINLTGTQLNNLTNLGSIIFDNKPTANRLLVFNITVSGTFDWTMANFAGLSEADGSFIIWNFYAPTTLNINGSNPIYGTVYAPDANIVKNNSNNLAGQVIGRSLQTTTGQIHNYTYKGTLPDVEQNITLPIHLISFSGNLQSGKPNLAWMVGENETGSYFVIERSTDGIEFTTAAMLMTTTTIGAESYRYKESKELTETTYYRLKLVNQDNSAYYSKLIRLAPQAELDSKIKLLQNPVQSSVNFQYNSSSSGVSTVSIFTLSGAKILSVPAQVVKGSNTISLNIEGKLNRGYYLLEVMNENERSVVKLIKN